MTSLIQKQKSFNLFLEGNNLCQITNHFLQQINQYFDEQVTKPPKNTLCRFSNGELHILDNKWWYTNIMQPKFYAVYQAQVEKTMQLPIICIYKDIKCLFSLLPDIEIYT